MLFLLLAFIPRPHEVTVDLRSLIKPKAAFFLLWALFFVVSHLWNFRTAPWNGNGLFDDSAVDLLYLKNYVIGHPFQAAWFHPMPFLISRETLFHYYIWGFLRLFSFNILSYEAALLVLWSGVFIFMLLLADLFLQSYIVTSVVALIVNFLPFAFLYTFVGYRYPLTVLLCVASLYFLHLGFRNASRLALSLGGIAAGLCLASSITGKQYVLALLVYGLVYAVLCWKTLTERGTWRLLAIVVYGFFAAATPILCYIAFNRADYTYYEGVFIHDFWGALHGHRSPHDLSYYVTQLPKLFFSVPGPRLFLIEFLPIPLPYYFILVPGFILALLRKRYDIVLLATIPVLGVFISAGITVEHRLLLAIPFWIILMGFAFAALLRLRLRPEFKIILLGVAASILATGFVPSVQYIYSKTKSPFAIYYYAQDQVAVSRFLKHVVAGQEHPGPPRLERDEFNRIKGIPDPSYETFICPARAWSIIHLFLHDYDDERVLAFCRGGSLTMLTQEEIWIANRKAILEYVPRGKDLKLIWQNDPKIERIRSLFESFRDLATEDSISFSFVGGINMFCVLNIPNRNIRQFQDRVRTLAPTPVQATPQTPPPQLRSVPEGVVNMFKGGKGTGKGEFDSPTGIAVDPNGNVLIADTGNGRIEKFSSTGAFLSIIGTKGSGQGQFAQPNGIAIDRVGNICVADAGNHRVLKLKSDGTFIAEWKRPELGFYGPRCIAIGADDSIYVGHQGNSRIVKFNPDGTVVTSWGSKGNGDGQFKDPTSVAVDPATNKVYVADPRNKRIQVFDSDGKFLTKWSVPEWGQPVGFEDLAIDSQTGRLYASSTHLDALLVFDLNGTRRGNVTPKLPDRLGGPLGLALANRKLYVLNMAGNRVSEIDL
jgi:DNA-binding beta-propeller fold protein YncE